MERGGFHGYRKNIPNNTNSGNNNMTNNIPVMMNNSHSNNNNHVTTEENECSVREQDRFMPIANVIRIMRKILPPHAKISDDAKETIQECVSEYISFITGEANERCQREQRKTITAEDVLWAMSKLGFDDYIEPLTLFLHRYRETEGDRTTTTPPPPAFPRRQVGPAGLEYAANLSPFGHSYGAAAPPPPGYYPSVNGFYGYYKDMGSGTGSSSGAGGASQAPHAPMAGSGDHQQHLQFK